ncbi:MAG TPA: glycosyltransferase [Chitinophagaceae bacterium]|jgi:glycosyltransferase involved in cell wall biosynthesis|nr:glycosyltransferase [Chitinophagaceae bacterium]
MNKPFISICIPTYNRAHLLKKLLDSIQGQRFKDYEIIINDNSPNAEVETLVSSYAHELPISFQRNQPAVSAGNNCIRVMQRANADWIKIMHDDDWFDSENALQLFADAALHSGKDFIFCASTQVWLDSDKKQEDILTPERKHMLDSSVFSLFYLNVIGHPSVAMHRKDSSIQYDSNFNWVLDIDFYVRYLTAHTGYHYLPQKLVNIGKGSTQESNKYYKNIKVELPEHFFLFSKYPQDLCLKDEYVFHVLWNMLKRYKVKNVAQIRAAGYNGILPAKIEEIINCQKYIPRIILKQTPWSKKLMTRCFNKLSINKK